MNPYGEVAGVTAEDQGTTDTSNSAPADTSNTSTAVPANSSSIDSLTLSHLFGFFNIMVGLMLVASLLLFFGGFIAYLTRLGLESRLQGLQYMYYGLTVLFVLIVLLGVINYVQFHPTIVFILIAIVAVILGAWLAVRISQQSGHEEEEH